MMDLCDLAYAIGCVLPTAVTTSSPYVFNELYVGLGFKIRFMPHTNSLVVLLFSWFYTSECRCKTLEEVDGLSAKGFPIRKFCTASLAKDKMS
jgi:hypothetical protein